MEALDQISHIHIVVKNASFFMKALTLETRECKCGVSLSDRTFDKSLATPWIKLIGL